MRRSLIRVLFLLIKAAHAAHKGLTQMTLAQVQARVTAQAAQLDTLLVAVQGLQVALANEKKSQAEIDALAESVEAIVTKTGEVLTAAKLP